MLFAHRNGRPDESGLRRDEGRREGHGQVVGRHEHRSIIESDGQVRIAIRRSGRKGTYASSMLGSMMDDGDDDSLPDTSTENINKRHMLARSLTHSLTHSLICLFAFSLAFIFL